MTEAASASTDPARGRPGIDTSVAHAARVYDYLLGGSENFPIDREVAERSAAAYGGLDRSRVDVRANRAFLGRAVRYLVGAAGIRQFLDIGTGLPNQDNVHGVAQREAADARIVYVDNDPLVLAHADTLLTSTSEGATAFIIGDLRDVENILLRAEATLDLGQPVAVMLIAILHLLHDDDDPYGIVSQLLDAVAPGSYLALSHLAKDVNVESTAGLAREVERMRGTVQYQFAMRTHAEVSRFLDGLELVEPGVVTVDRWRPVDSGAPTTAIYGAIARKP